MVAALKEKDAKGSFSEKEVDMKSPATTPIAHYRIEKKHALGLIIPQNQTLHVLAIDPHTKLIQGPAYITSSMSYIDIATAKPPAFELLTAHDEKRETVSVFDAKSWQGLVSMKSEFQVSCHGDVQKWSLAQKGASRAYHLKEIQAQEGKEFVWKGSTRAVRAMTGGEKKHTGNLKLCANDGEVLALWHQWRDSLVLGDILIFDSARDVLGLEVVVTSCIAAVSAERATGMNWYGGLGKW